MVSSAGGAASAIVGPCRMDKQMLHKAFDIKDDNSPN